MNNLLLFIYLFTCRPGGEMDYLRLYDMVDIPMEVPDMDINFN